jgi:modulator of FtsH protease
MAEVHRLFVFYRSIDKDNSALFSFPAGISSIPKHVQEEKQMNATKSKSIALPYSGSESILATNRVLRNTYMLLSMTLLFAAAAAGASAALKLPHPGILITLAGYFGLLFAIHRLQNSGWGVALVFALTGFMGYTLGPIINHYLGLPNGGQTVMLAMGGTAAIFLGLSAYALTSKRDFTFMGGFLTAGILLAFLAGLAAIFFEIPALSLTVSAAFVLLMSGLILYETSNIVRGGETNYVLEIGRASCRERVS